MTNPSTSEPRIEVGVPFRRSSAEGDMPRLRDTLTNRLLWLELVAVFIGLPLLLRSRLISIPAIPLLLLAATVAAIQLYRWGFRLTHLAFWPGARRLQLVFVRAALCCAAMGLCVWWFAPHRLFELITTNPGVWAVIVLLYPLLSVLPQELLFRTYFFHRYRSIFRDDMAMVLASALTFGFVHIIYGNWVSVGLSAIGGVLFSITYIQTGSLLAACVEHAIFGDFLFTIGLGGYFVNLAR